MAESETTPATAKARSLLRQHLSLSRVQAVVGVTAGLISIVGALYTYVLPRTAPPPMGELVSVVRDARTDKPLPDATVEVLTANDAVVTTAHPDADGRIHERLREGQYRIRASHPRLGAETRQIEIVAGRTSEVPLTLSARAARARSRSVGRAVTDTVGETVGAIRRLLR